MKKTTQELQTLAAQVRRDIIRMVAAAKSGHPGGSMGATDIITSLYFDVMNASPETFTYDGKGQDVFYLSNGHISPVLYSVMARRGYFPVSELGTFRMLGSRLQGHPTPSHGLPGIRVGTGSLGQGLSVAIGHALGKRLDGDPAHVFAMVGDGELEEGQIWEAAMFAAARKVDNIVVIVDMNGQQIDGTCADILGMGCPQGLRAKWEAFGWRVLEMDGHDIPEVIATLTAARDNECGHGVPVIILAHTVMGKGVDFMENTNEFHGRPTNPEETERALAQLPVTPLGDY